MILTKALLPLGLAFIMFSMGLSLIPEDFRRVFLRPKPIIIGLISQIVLLPLIAFMLLYLWPLSPELAVGVMILAACPGGVTSNLLTHLARGDVALSISLTAITSVIGLVSLPFIVNAALGYFSGLQQAVHIPVGGMMIGVLLVSTLPLVLGMWVNYKNPLRSNLLAQKGRHISTVIFVLIVIATFVDQWQSLAQHFGQVGPLVIGLNVVTIGLALLFSRFFLLSRAETVAISMECGLQNGALGIFVALTLLESSLMVVPSIIYALVMNISAVCLILVSVYRAGCFKKPFRV